jgi:hypothetical protein
MHYHFLILFASFLSVSCAGQGGGFLAYEDNMASLNPFDRLPLFDSAEIKKRKIDSVYIIYHPASWIEYHETLNPCTCPYNDTISLYRFDIEGRIIQYTKFDQLGDFATTFLFDSNGNRVSRSLYRRRENRTTTHYFNKDSADSKSIVIRNKTAKDIVETEITLTKFTHGFDTSLIEKRRYNSKGKLIEIKRDFNKRNAQELGLHTGEMAYHFKYNDKGRLIYFRDFNSSVYKKISYPFYGKLTEVYNSSTNQLQEQEIKLINEQNDVTIITSDNKQIILTPLEKGSKLFKLRTIVTPGEFPLMEYHEIQYKKR